MWGVVRVASPASNSAHSSDAPPRSEPGFPVAAGFGSALAFGAGDTAALALLCKRVRISIVARDAGGASPVRNVLTSTTSACACSSSDFAAAAASSTSAAFCWVDLVHLRDGLVDLLDAGALLLASGR